MRKTEKKKEKKSREKEFPDSEELCCWGLTRQWAGGTEMGTDPRARAGGQGQGGKGETFSWSKRWGKGVGDEQAIQLWVGRINIHGLGNLPPRKDHRDHPELSLTSPNQLLGARNGG